MKVITVTNQKGGTGKTSTVLFLAHGLAKREKKILVIDLDQQADASFSFNIPYDNEQTTFQVLTENEALNNIIVKVNDAIDLAPASSDISRLDIALSGKYRPQFILKDAISKLSKNYDYILIDTPPALSMVVLNALTASEAVIVPTQADIYSLKGLTELASTINTIKETSNPDLKIAGILIGRYNARTIFSKSIANAFNEMTKRLHTTVFETKIREAISVKESQNNFESIFDYDPHGKVTQDVNKFIDEFIQKEN